MLIRTTLVGKLEDGIQVIRGVYMKLISAYGTQIREFSQIRYADSSKVSQSPW